MIIILDYYVRIFGNPWWKTVMNLKECKRRELRILLLDIKAVLIVSKIKHKWGTLALAVAHLYSGKDYKVMVHYGFAFA